MTSIPGPPIDWSFQFAQQMLDAAMRCDTDDQLLQGQLERRYVNPYSGTYVANDGCAQLVARVDGEGWRKLNMNDRCEAARVVTVTLVLDLCATVLAADLSLDPVKASAEAQEQAQIRWLIQHGLRQAWKSGALCAGECADGANFGPPGAVCARVIPGQWRGIPADSINRWETRWEHIFDL